MSNLNLHLQQNWLHDKCILSYNLYSLNNSIMLDWSQAVLDAISDWQGNGTPRLLFDLSNTNVSMSYFVLTGRDLFNFVPNPIARAKFDTLRANQPHLRVKLAVFLSKTMVGVITGSERSTDTLQELVIGKVFFEQEAALQWLTAADDYVPDVRTRAIDVNDLLSKTDLGSLVSETYRPGVNELRLLVNGSLEIVPIDEEHPVTIGRSAQADLDVSTHGKPSLTVSRQHARIALTNGELSITDLGSTNGTFIGEIRLEAGKARPLSREEEVRVGALNIRVLS